MEVANPGGCPLAHNGTVVPIAVSEGVMELHYFPRLGGEFFISEPGIVPISQAHAGPAGDYLRLEVESRVVREYEWVVHHVTPAIETRCTGCGTAPVTSYEEAKGLLRVRVKSPANSDLILNISLKEPL